MNSIIRVNFTLFTVVFFILQSVNAYAAEPGYDEYLYARKLFDEKYYDLAADQLERVLRDFPNLTEKEEAQFLLGEAYLYSNEYEGARAAFLRLAITYPKSPRAAEALFNVGVVLEKSEDSPGAAEAYARVFGFYPKDRYSPIGLKRSADIYIEIGDTVAAEVKMDQLIENFPGSEVADCARLQRALMMMGKTDRLATRRHLEWIAERAGSDSIAAVASLELGKLHRENHELDAAAVSFRKPIDKFPGTELAALASVELADLLNYRGLMTEALEVLTPALLIQNKDILTKARIKAGDAYYRLNDYKNALAYYSQTVDDNPEGAVKTAWTMEKLGSKSQAFSRYIQISSTKSKYASEACRRAAILSGEFGQWDKAAQLWAKLLNNSEYPDPDGIINFELVKARAKSGESIRGAAQRAIARYKQSPYLDEIAYLNYAEELSVSLEGNLEDLQDPFTAMKSFPASEWLDSAIVLNKFFINHKVKSRNLMERMAELSSRSQNSVSKAKWAMDWGDFYLDEFKDPIKALDQYSSVLDQIIVTPEDLLYSYRSILEAYMYLYEEAIWEVDTFSVEMYGDSCYSWLGQLNEIDPGSDDTRKVITQLRRLDLRAVKDDPFLYNNVLDSIEADIAAYGIERIPVDIIAEYLSGKLNSGQINTEDLNDLIAMVKSAIDYSHDKRLTAKLTHIKVILMEMNGEKELALETGRKLSLEYPNTEGGAEALGGMIENPLLSVEERYKTYEQFTSLYPYLVIPVIHFQIAAVLLDSMNFPLEALTARKRWKAAVEWEQPRLDIFEMSDEASIYYQARSYQKASQLLDAQEQYRALLNLNPQGKFSAACYLHLAELKFSLGSIQLAVAYVDTLALKFPNSLEYQSGMRMLPVLLMEIEDYEKALHDWGQLSLVEINPDSTLKYQVQSVVCLYRLGKSEEARLRAKELYKQYKDNADLDQYKALFYLEKGLALDKAGNHENARKQYETIIESYSLSEWSDDAAFSMGRSLIMENKVEEGIAELKKFTENFPDSSLAIDALLTIGLTAFREGDFSESVSALKKVWEWKKGERLWKTAFESLISVYKAARFWDAAVQLTRDYIDRFPDATDLLNRQMDLGWFMLQLGQWEVAIDQYRSLLPIADAEKEAEVQFYIGEAYMNAGNYRMAILEYLKVKVLGRKTKLDWGVTAIYKSGLCYEALNEPEGAARMYRMIIAERGETSNYGMTAKKRLNELKKE
ncbi:tetratricopeptide repeat protein [bacterium]|nr:tetratricopeptide repeat protein [bacterium]